MDIFRHLIQLMFILTALELRSEDGYRLWLRYELNESYSTQISSLVIEGNDPTSRIIRNELLEGLSGMLNRSIALDAGVTPGALIVGTPSTSPLIARLDLEEDLAPLQQEGFIIRSITIDSSPCTIIAANGETGALYGAFHFLHLMQTNQSIDSLAISQKPRFQLRLLNHWDNLDGSIERGYAGNSLWDWDSLPYYVDLRLIDYARANASIGINGIVLNNVNTDSTILTIEYLEKVACLADLFRPYGLKVYLSARFSAPIELGKLKTADPLDPQVREWWAYKVSDIYELIPDFGGFLVKANSEGQPGPLDYQRTHVDGANLFASALSPYGGVVIWRAFVYDLHKDDDRAGASYKTFKPLDGKFASNALLQIKNGPIDFQPREPFHPLFGSMPNTQLVPEVQITQEYLGFSNHIAFLPEMWSEFLHSDTHAEGPGSTVAKVADGSLNGQKITGFAGVANIGSDRNWTGHHFAQGNWYGFGRLAWDPDLTPASIAREWIAKTFTRDEDVVKRITKILLHSREAVVDYMTPLGLHHIMSANHYGPAPWRISKKHTRTYHRADLAGLGFDRTESGSNTVSQYHSQVGFGTLQTCPEKFLLWFHHVPWTYPLSSGNTLWEELALHYQQGVDWVRKASRKWNRLAGKIDPERHLAVAEKLTKQESDAVWWKDAALTYFQTFSNLPFPEQIELPKHPLEMYRETRLKP